MAPRTMQLRDSHLWQGERYGPSAIDGETGQMIPTEVPDDFPKAAQLKGLDAPKIAKTGASDLDRNEGGPPANLRSSDTEDDPRAAALAERLTDEGEEIPLGVTGDRLGHANTGLHTVSHPEALPVGATPVRGTRITAPVGAGLPDADPANVTASQSGTGTGTGRTAAAKAGARGRTALSREALDEMTVPELKELASEREVTVERGDGKEGDPLREDYIDALAGKR